MSYDRDITFEVAKRAKEKGLPQRDYSEGYTATGDWCGDFAIDVINGRECYAITTQGELVSWLRCVHKIHIVMPYNKRYKCWDAVAYDMNAQVDFCQDDLYGMSYEEALENFLAIVLCRLLLKDEV